MVWIVALSLLRLCMRRDAGSTRDEGRHISLLARRKGLISLFMLLLPTLRVMIHDTCHVFDMPCFGYAMLFGICNVLGYAIFLVYLGYYVPAHRHLPS